ncbi:transposase [Burkholderia ubonensis]|uniref:Transposase n=1 Tax=Burkholderia ubonensis TaxID=101571 RepID=A0A107FN09_9BURK|nr:transposase [Burkholderia ubonensis]KWD71530.1 transposase [Burkholderia ubonensis]KWD79468.1 transposase [Burkholderia ubonensis]KWD96522.1 transposase [Burkholderia ubonensis]KWD97864.1 transposase [Burkholderia ubonensis]
MFFDELNDEEWVRLSTLIADEPIRLNRRGRPRAEPRVVANAVLWILTTGEAWSKLPGRYPSGPTCRRRYEEWLANGTLLQMIDVLTQFSGRTFAYVPPPPVPVTPARRAEPAPDNDRLRGVFWQNPESWQLPQLQGMQANVWRRDDATSRSETDVPAQPAFIVPGAPAAAEPAAGLSERHHSRASTASFTTEPQVDMYRGYTVYGIAQPVQNLMYRAWAEIVHDERRVERSGLIGPRFTDAEEAEQYALEWARQWIDRHGAGDEPARAPQSVPVLAGLSALAQAESDIKRFVAERHSASLADGRNDPVQSDRLAYRVG